jgi:hypothetical protein
LQNIKVLESARVPVVKFTVPGPNTHVDVTINNLLPLRNTALIAAYTAIDPRLRDMVFLIKHWAKSRHIADAYQSTLSSYAWVLMCIFVAQRAGLVPVLHREEPKHVDEEVEVAGKIWKCQFNTDVEKHSAAARGHWITTGGLLTMFFDYFATRCGAGGSSSSFTIAICGYSVGRVHHAPLWFQFFYQGHTVGFRVS